MSAERKGETMAERIARLEEWTSGHEQRCEARQGAMATSIKELKDTAKTAGKALWACLLAVLGFLAMQVYDHLAHPTPLAAPAAVATVTTTTTH